MPCIHYAIASSYKFRRVAGRFLVEARLITPRIFESAAENFLLLAFDEVCCFLIGKIMSKANTPPISPMR